MNNKTFLITIALVLTLVAIGLSPLGKVIQPSSLFLPPTPPPDLGNISGSDAVSLLQHCMVRDMWGYGAPGDVRGPIHIGLKSGYVAEVDSSEYGVISNVAPATGTTCVSGIPRVMLVVP